MPGRLTILLLLLICGTFSCTNVKKMDLQVKTDASPVRLAVEKFKEMDHTNGIEFSTSNPDLVISGKIDTSLKSEEAYRIRQDGKNITVTGGGTTGLVYGLYEVRKHLSEGKTKIQVTDQTPHYDFRAIKFNLPWSSYRKGEALQQHYETCRDTVFWESFLDMMVENRFNKLTLWNLHPFNYLVKSESFPEANSMSDEEFAQWRQFWISLFRMAKDRGIETYLVNWNIFVSPEFAKAHNVANYSIDGTYFTEGDTAAIIKDYMRESVKQVIDEYPDLTGLGITLGEAMGGMTADEREQWLLDSFIEGMRMASRKIKFIHRVPLSAGTGSGGTTNLAVEKMTRRTLDTLTCVDTPVIIELKYNWSHGHSSPHLFKVHGGKLTDAYWNPLPTNYKLSWMVRNEDFFMLRWGQPDFIRKHIELNSQDYVVGYFVGSETYIPALDYFTKGEKGSWRYAFQRQWMFYKQWGHLLYDPDTPDEFFAGSFQSRFPGKGNALFEAQSLVGRLPLIVGSYWDATWDYTLYSEGMLSIMGRDSMHLISLVELAQKTPMDTALMGVFEYVNKIGNNNFRSEKIAPVEMADSIESFCTKAIELVEKIDPAENTDLLYEKTDILTWAWLGLYFADKLRAAVDYQQFVNSGNEKFHEQAVNHLEKATSSWGKVSNLTSDVYKAVPLQHLNRNKDKYFHWNKVYREVKDELEWLKNDVTSGSAFVGNEK